ncbi:aminoglycoside phosphotransferase family protein [Maribacter polysiphoniae]|uniref:Aminoglycoside phosphotransferase family protein n=1 Tax=Maribacter polysiphoniae TaxID=429344 RepID=A0A316E666_9FLAO|nr:aminoglycoside phosphotransferase family protein [Maribacter polysiphoniae]MBD1260105.1 aminoglycoside phosphotransferase family protein [Maribacter polysiphoniae]PWK25566.1 phosphotransferase family enzyme [Maribacter polysiphoniae]
MLSELNNIAKQFQVEGEIESIKPLGEGFINDTYILKTIGEDSPNYLFQRKNKTIFKDVPSMMDNIHNITTHLKAKIVANGGDPLRETMTLTKTHDGRLYQLDEEGEFWTMCLFIDDSVSYESADTPELAYSGGKGIGKFQRMTSDYKGQLVDILPGFHNIRFRFEQWDEVLAKDPVGRKSMVMEEISWIEDRREEMLQFWTLVEEGTIPTRVTHNDTKINNILFDKKGDVLCMIDLDTVLSSTALNDFGDAMRSYTNTGLEDDTELDNVSMDLEIFTAYTKGYLEEAKSFLVESEMDYLAFSAKYITYEQVLRFLMDYIAGDTYYKIKSPEHNLVRTHAQYKLLQSMEAQFKTMQDVVKSYL